MLLSGPTVNYTSPNSTGSLTFAPAAFTSGTANITVTVTDNGGTQNGGINMVQQSFTVTVLPVNQTPTLAPINVSPVILENNTSPVTINLTNITAGLGDTTQGVTVSATSSEPAVIPDPAVTYTSPSTTGTLTFAPQAFVSGVVTITVTVMDNGGTANGAIDTVQQSFIVTITPINQQPAFTVTGPAAIIENSGQQTVNVSQISVGAGDTATGDATVTAGQVTALTVTDGGNGYSSANPPTVTIAPPNGGGGTQATATAIVTNGIVTGFTITSPGSGYSRANPPRVTVADGQSLTVSATSSNLSIIPNPVFSFTAPATLPVCSPIRR